MTDKEIELAMEGLFRGASQVRARKYAKKLSSTEKFFLTDWDRKESFFI